MTNQRHEANESQPDVERADVQRRLQNVEAELVALREMTNDHAREIALMRADLERLRQESEKAAGSKMP
jgi:hypothetical protein